MIIPRIFVPWAFTVLSAFAANAPAPAPVAPPTINGVEFTLTAGAPTAAKIDDPTALKPEDYQALRKVETLKTINFGRGIDDASLKILAGMPVLESISTNGMAITDAGVATLASFPALRGFTCFHPGKGFTGTGFTALSGTNLENVTVAGSLLFSNEGMKAVGGLQHLKSFRTWHSGVTLEGVKALAGLRELTTLSLGQRLANKPPATLDDDAVGVLAGIPSLEMLNLQEAKLSLPALLKLKDLPKLKQLTLAVIEIPEADVNTLKQALPNVKLSWTAPSPEAMKRIDGIFNPAPPPTAQPAPPAAKKP